MTAPSAIRAGYEPIPGYILRKRLGAGGYGEVWSADAPGGLKKAVKLVFGTLDEQRASSELRSLQRIRQVHHPLLLSIERIEIVHGQLIIVTELAESSLTDYFHAARRRQMQGIPREQLLELLRDAGDALDYLSQKHDLQHLDVKPGNLLLMADRIKVADFGLIKDLHATNVSIVSGLTPTHAAPELFDGRPDRLSDLYSLAIVYQEMLTGKLPFEGKTAGELARQHLHQAPNLEPLPPADRRVVARALAKHPLDRYPSCRAFIEELRKSGTHEKYAAKSRISSSEGEIPTDQVQAESKETSTCTSPALLGGLEVLKALPTADSAEGWQSPLCMFIGAGGLGCLTLTSLRNLLDQKVDNRRRSSDHQWMAIDTDFDLLSEISSAHHTGSLNYRNTCHLKIFRPQDYRTRSEDRFNAISRRWLYNIPRSLKTDGVRPLGMLALVDHYEEVERRIYDQLKKLLTDRKDIESTECQPIRIYVCSSLHGGTGSAISADLGRIVRRVMSQLNCTDYFLTATLSIATTAGPNGSLPAAAALASLCELDAQMDASQFIPSIGLQTSLKQTGSSKPFDWVTIVDGGVHSSADDASSTVDALAESIWIDSHTLIGMTLDAARHEQGPHHASSERDWLRAARSSFVQLGLDLQPAQIARVCCAQAIKRWQACLTESAPTTANRQTSTQNAGWSSAQTAAIIEHLSSECLRNLQIAVDDSPSPASAKTSNANTVNPWHNRVSQSEETIRLQLERDVRVWRQWLSEQMRPSYVSWDVLQRIALRIVERLLSFAGKSDKELKALAANESGDRTRFTTAEVTRLRKYVELLSSRVLEQLQSSQPQIELFSNTMRTWLRSLQAEQTMREGDEGLSLTDLHVPVGWRHTLQRVGALLDSTLHRFVVSRCFNALAIESSNQETTAGLLSLEHILRLSDELVNRFMREAGIDAPITTAHSSSTRSVVLQEVSSMIPPAAQRGGKMYRLIAVTPAQQSALLPRLKQLDMDESCTIVPAQFGEEPVAVCDAGELNLSGIIASFWRPTPEIFRLAERLHTRSDVAWPTIDTLLSSPSSPLHSLPSKPSCL